MRTLIWRWTNLSSKVYNARKIAVLAAICIGILYMVAAFFIFSRQDYDRATNDMRQTMQYVNAQFMEFKKLDTASEAKSLTRMMDKINQISMKLEDAPQPVTEEILKQYATDLRVTGIILLKDNGELICEYGNDGFSLEKLKKEILRKPVLDVAKNPKKIYTRRIALEDGSFMDIGAHQRADAPGIIVCYYHTLASYIENYNLSLNNLFSSYSKDMTGTIVVTDGYKILASNDEKFNGVRIDKNPIVEKLRKDGHRGELLKISGIGPETYYGSLERGRDFYAYVYFSESKVYATRWTKLGDALVFYLVVVSIFFYILRRSEQEHLKKQHEIDEKYKEQLILSAREAERANNAKTEFLQRMSHDIRTPINGIRGMLEIAGLNMNDHAKVNECLVKIGEASSYLLDLVSEILDMGKLSSGDIALEHVSFDLRKLCDEVLALMRRQAEAKDIDVSLRRDESIPRFLIGSPVHVKRILVNVLNNAIKYNKLHGKVYLRMKELERKDDVITLEFSCEDTGIGISEAFLPHVFEAFTQDIDTARSEYEGSGLGMPIVKTLVDKMGGSITATSKQGEGSKFVIRLSFTIDKAMPQEAVKEKFDAAIVRGLHVLMAEDNTLNMEIAKFFLDKAGVTYTAVNNGQEAVAAFKASKPYTYDAILMDVMMPVMDGLEATRQIRALEREDAKSVPIIAMTANAFVEDRQKAFAAGMNEHVTKPLQSDVLLKALAEQTKNKKC